MTNQPGVQNNPMQVNQSAQASHGELDNGLLDYEDYLIGSNAEEEIPGIDNQNDYSVQDYSPIPDGAQNFQMPQAPMPQMPMPEVPQLQQPLVPTYVAPNVENVEVLRQVEQINQQLASMQTQGTPSQEPVTPEIDYTPSAPEIDLTNVNLPVPPVDFDPLAQHDPNTPSGRYMRDYTAAIAKEASGQAAIHSQKNMAKYIQDTQQTQQEEILRANLEQQELNGVASKYGLLPQQVADFQQFVQNPNNVTMDTLYNVYQARQGAQIPTNQQMPVSGYNPPAPAYPAPTNQYQGFQPVQGAQVHPQSVLDQIKANSMNQYPKGAMINSVPPTQITPENGGFAMSMLKQSRRTLY